MSSLNSQLSIILVDPKKIHKPPYCVEYDTNLLETIENNSLRYQLYLGKIQVFIDISFPDDITKALSESRFENRSFQACQNELWQEWNIKSGGDLRRFVEHYKNYHIEFGGFGGTSTTH
jgi:hypothetical protein